MRRTTIVTVEFVVEAPEAKARRVADRIKDYALTYAGEHVAKVRSATVTSVEEVKEA